MNDEEFQSLQSTSLTPAWEHELNQAGAMLAQWGYAPDAIKLALPDLKLTGTAMFAVLDGWKAYHAGN